MRNLTKQAGGEEFDYLSRILFFVSLDGHRTDGHSSRDIRFSLAFCAHVLDGAWPEKRQDESLVLLAPERRQADQTGDYFALSRESLH